MKCVENKAPPEKPMAGTDIGCAQKSSLWRCAQPRGTDGAFPSRSTVPTPVKPPHNGVLGSCLVWGSLWCHCSPVMCSQASCRAGTPGPPCVFVASLTRCFVLFYFFFLFNWSLTVSGVCVEPSRYLQNLASFAA